MSTRPLKVVILAAGQGKRMKSALPKVLHPVAGRAMLSYVLDAARGVEPHRILVVVSPPAERIRKVVGEAADVEYVVQEERLGTGHALLCAREALGVDPADCLVLCGDSPLLRAETLRRLVRHHRSASGAVATVLTACPEDPTGYGRVLRDPTTGAVLRIVEETDASPEDRSVREVNTGIYCFSWPEVLPYLERLTPDNRQKELYLPDVLSGLVGDGRRVEAVATQDPGEVQGVNDRVQLARVEAGLRMEILMSLMCSGVTVTDPASTYVDWGVEVGPDSVLEPGTVLRGRTIVGPGCRVGPWAYLEDAVLGPGCRVFASVVEGSELEAGASVGPFSHLRPQTRVGTGAKIGNFAEVKNSSVGPRTKIPHHSYVGDADLGPDVNVGAGAVVVNYDGLRKHRTVVGRGAFVGCNTNLVAPVTVGDGAYTAAGSTVTRDVPPGALAVSRARQENFEGWVERRRAGTVSAEAARAAGPSGPGTGGGGDEHGED